MGSARIPKVDSLIVESTFGLPQYVFPPIQDIVHLTNKIIGEMFDKGVSVLLLGYPLGKANAYGYFSTGHLCMFMIQSQK